MSLPKWITIKKFSEHTGYTEKAVRAKIDRGQWPQGPLWMKSPDHRIQINLEAYYRWVEGTLRVA
jgi:hypothetical protein